MDSILMSLFSILAVGFIYKKASKKIDEKERNGKSDVSDAFLLLLIAMSGVPFALMFFVSIFVVATR